MLALPFFLANLLCTWFQCEIQPQPPYFSVDTTYEKQFLSKISGFSVNQIEGEGVAGNGPIAQTKLGPVEGYTQKTSQGREIFAFTGVPYGEAPVGHLRFRDPVPRKPWKGLLKATSKSPICVQANAAFMGMIRGQEDCLYLDIFTPRLPVPGEKNRTGLPVIMWIPAGTAMYGRSFSYGPAYLLNEDVILVPLNIRYGVLGYLASGDAASPGNWGLKDQALAVEWVHENIAAFGGDPNRIVIGGIFSGSYSQGIIGMSGNVMCNHGLDARGRVQEASDIVAREAGCPTAGEGKSWEMVECMRKKDPYMLAAHQFRVYWEMPHMSKMWGPTIEPDLPNAYISELPETLYEKGEVPPIPMILTRIEDEIDFFAEATRRVTLKIYRLNWWDWAPKFVKLAFRTTKLGEEVSNATSHASMMKVNRFYFGKDTPPLFSTDRDYYRYLEMTNDAMYNAPLWKSLELHNKVGPTYSYIFKHFAFGLNPNVKLMERVLNKRYKASHASDFGVLFNNTHAVPALKPGGDFEIASRNLVNLLVNFATYGKPLYRTMTGELLPLWTTIGDVNKMMVLDVGLVHNISMILDPLPATMRMKIWEQTKW